MLTPGDALAHLRRIVFKIRIEKNKQGAWEWGTGFFITADGYALTAFHNLPAAVRRSRKGTICAEYQATWIELECFVTSSLREVDGDIAMLRHIGGATISIEHLPIAYLDTSLPIDERSRFWAGRAVSAFGFPLEKEGQGERIVDGIFDSVQPLVEIDRKSLGGRGPSITGTTEWMCFYGGDRARELEGISGAPILDRQTGWIVAVEHRYIPEQKLVYATEIGRLATRWEGVIKHGMPLKTPRGPDGPDMPNPFTWRGAITEAAAFFGREKEQRLLRAYLGSRSNCQIVGPRRIGKSSLLRQVERAASVWREGTVIAYLDLQDPRCFTLAGWLRHASARFGWSAVSLTEFREGIEQMLADGRRPVLCLDEVEELMTRRAEFTGDFFLSLRSCGQAGLSIVTASRRLLSELTEPGDPTSPFYNIFPMLSLGPLDAEDAEDFVNLHRKGVPPFTSEERRTLLEFARGHPLALQVACFHTLHAKGGAETLATAMRRAADDMRASLPTGW